MNRYKPNNWYGICQVCGRKFLSHKLKERWDGFIVCPDDFEIRHDLDFIRMPRESKPVPFIRKPPSGFDYILRWDDVFKDQTPYGGSNYTGQGTSSSSFADNAIDFITDTYISGYPPGSTVDIQLGSPTGEVHFSDEQAVSGTTNGITWTITYLTGTSPVVPEPGTIVIQLWPEFVTFSEFWMYGGTDCWMIAYGGRELVGYFPVVNVDNLPAEWQSRFKTYNSLAALRADWQYTKELSIDILDDAYCRNLFWTDENWLTDSVYDTDPLQWGNLESIPDYDPLIHTRFQSGFIIWRAVYNS